MNGRRVVMDQLNERSPDATCRRVVYGNFCRRVFVYKNNQIDRGSVCSNAISLMGCVTVEYPDPCMALATSLQGNIRLKLHSVVKVAIFFPLFCFLGANCYRLEKGGRGNLSRNSFSQKYAMCGYSEVNLESAINLSSGGWLLHRVVSV